MADDLRIALAQMNAVVGDVDGNAKKIEALAAEARDAGAGLVVFPELALTGYPPEDLLLKSGFLRRAQAALESLAISGITAIVGWPEASDGHVYNSAAVVADGKVGAVYRKQLLPNYGVFDERRWFEPGHGPVVVDVGGTPVGITVCEDIWAPEPTAAAAAAGARVVVNLSASPYHHGKGMEREAMIAELARDNGVTMAFCNLVGGQDELVFDGHSLIVTADGEVAARGPQFDEALVLPGQLSDPLPPEEEVYRALVTGVRDYVEKNGFDKVVIASSGGIDSALTVLVAVDALGPERVVTVTMPSRYSSEGHEVGCPDPVGEPRGRAARDPDRAGDRGVRRASRRRVRRPRARPDRGEPPGARPRQHRDGPLEQVRLARAHDREQVRDVGRLRDALRRHGRRVRGPQGRLQAVGLPARAVAQRPGGPRDSSRRRCSSGLLRRSCVPISATTSRSRPTRCSTRSSRATSRTTWTRASSWPRACPEEDVGRVIRLVDLAEYKRRQAPPGVKISPKAFGRDRRLPITNRWRG